MSISVIKYFTSSLLKPSISLNLMFLVISLAILKPLVVLSNVIGATPVINILSTTDSVPSFNISYHFLTFPFLATNSLNSSVLNPNNSFAKWSYSSIITYIFSFLLCSLNASNVLPNIPSVLISGLL